MKDLEKDLYVESTVFWQVLQNLDGFVLHSSSDVYSHKGIIKNGNNYQKIFIKINDERNSNNNK